MVKIFPILVEEKEYEILVSDEQEALLAAKAAGRAVVGLWDSRHPEQAPFGVPYLAEAEEACSAEYLERVMRRHLGLPWRIAETGHLILREFAGEDWDRLQEMLAEAAGGSPLSPWENIPEAFLCREAFDAYRKFQYAFYEYGIWAVIEKEGGQIIGAAGIWNLEENLEGTLERAEEGALKEDIKRKAEGDEAEPFEAPPLEIGYWICPAFQRKGYGQEAVNAILSYADENLESPIYAKIREENIPSRKLAVNAGFQLAGAVRPDSRRTESRQLWYQYAPYY
ncbi:MAG: GNAT family N-acetyltransferase [Lachnospiraceae bacterium]|nr:GNAT family N-acetyltransferase [Lachnospiraceae bacterium]